MSQNNDRLRRPRYKRDDKTPRPGKFQVRGDAAIILLVHEYRYITRPLLELLTGRKGTGLKNRLRYLYDNGYLDKVHFSRSYRETGSTPDIYVLDEKGRKKYQELTGQDADTSALKNQNKDPQLEHTLLINTFRTLITCACSQIEGVELLDWKRAGKDNKDQVQMNGRMQTIAPDAFFVIRKPNGRISPFFLEADRSTMDGPTFTDKLKAYYAFWRTIRDELDRQAGQGKKEVSNRFNIQGFRVLTVIEQETPWQLGRNHDRLSHLMEAGLKATGGKGWKGYWYTSKPALDLVHPESALKAIWQIAHPQEQGTTHSLLE